MDLWNGAVNIYKSKFRKMEEDNLLDAADEIHLWVLHFVFLPRINRSLDLFVQQWNNHGIRTAGYKSPLRLFILGVMHNRNSSLAGIHPQFS